MKRWICLLLALCVCLPVTAGTADTAAFYRLGDQVADFTLTTADGETVTLYGLLAEYKAVLLNFWFAGCAPCRYEFPYLQNAYEEMGDEVAILAVTPYDDDETIRGYQGFLGLTLPMARDTAGITDRYAVFGFPTNVLIDRDGVVCYTKAGAQPSTDAFLRLLTLFTGEDYSGPLLLSSIPEPMMPPAPDDDLLSAALNAEGGSLLFAQEGGWPWLVDAEGFAKPGNSGANGSAAAVSVQISAQVGDALRFRFFTSTEEAGDLLAILVDGTIRKAFSGENPWQTYTLPLHEGEHTVSFLYSKNDRGAAGQDTAGLRDVALLSGAEAALALAENPTYPHPLPGYHASVTFLGQEARQIAFDDPEGAVNAYYGADGYYILPEGQRMARIDLGRACDPDAACYQTLDGTARVLSRCPHDDTGYYVYLPAPNPDLGWNALLVFPSLTDDAGLFVRLYIYFDSPDAVDDFCLSQIFSPVTGELLSNITWDYAL